MAVSTECRRNFMPFEVSAQFLSDKCQEYRIGCEGVAADRSGFSLDSHFRTPEESAQSRSSTKMKPEVEYLPDSSVDDALDHDLRSLLATCFTKPEDAVFRHRRYFEEPYPNRWVIRDGRGAIVAHIGGHEKHVEVNGQSYRVGGIGDVCVHPDHRGKGSVRTMLECVHGWLSGHGFVFAVLFGDPRVYGSSGYVEVSNLYYGGGKEGWKQVDGLVKELSEIAWPGGEVRLPGPKF